MNNIWEEKNHDSIQVLEEEEVEVMTHWILQHMMKIRTSEEVVKK